MAVLVIYDTVTPNRNTEKVAKTVTDAVQKMGVQADSVYVKDVDASRASKYDCILVGGPTHYRKATDTVMQFLDSLSSQEYSGKMAAAFDTKVKHPLAGSAAKDIEKRLKKLGFKIVKSPLEAYVVKNKTPEKREDYLQGGELDKAAKWVEEFAQQLQKK